MRIVGIMLVQNEDLFVERAIRNTIAICDEFLVADHQSTDGTAKILERLAEEFPDKLKLRKIDHPRESHQWIRQYVNSPTWIFGVDGDEIYDPTGLARLRISLEAGEFENQWCIFGNVLNVRDCDFASGQARGHLAPPCRSMTKFYNFQAIKNWDGPDCVERLHGGKVEFQPGFHDLLRRNLHQEMSWEDSPFRCLHLCFIPRSSQERAGGLPRKNIMDRHAWSLKKLGAKLLGLISGQGASDWKEQRYGRGPIVEKSLEPFFPSSR